MNLLPWLGKQGWKSPPATASNIMPMSHAATGVHATAGSGHAALSRTRHSGPARLARLRYQQDSELVQWYRLRVAAGKKPTVVIVARARKLLIALWRLVTIGEIPQGWVVGKTELIQFRPASR
jgi:hypothetical protein